MARSNLVPKAFEWNKKKRVTFSVAIVQFDMKMHSNATLRNFRGQGHLVTLSKGHLSVVCQHFQRASPLTLLVQFQLNFMCSFQVKRERIFGPGQITNMVSMPI